LTVSGLIGTGNRGPINKFQDQRMVKQKISFNTAHAFDFAAITALPAVTIEPTLEYDGVRHMLKGPLLIDVLKSCGVRVQDGMVVFLRAVDGYAAQVSVADAIKYRFIVATHLDGLPMSLGGLGPCGRFLMRTNSPTWQPSRCRTGSRGAPGLPVTWK
jgi:hypothetical protein